MNVDRVAVRASAADLRSSALVSLLVLLPFFLESVRVSRTITTTQAQFLFLLWVIQLTFLVAILPVVRYAKEANGAVNLVSVTVRIIVAGFLLAAWTGLLVDQMPVFVGFAVCAYGTAITVARLVRV